MSAGRSPRRLLSAGLRGSNSRLALAPIVVLALALRLTGLDWDEGHHLHPDERFISIVESRTSFPSSVDEYFDSGRSPLNPANLEPRAAYAYGTLPLFVGKAVATVLGQDGYDRAYLVGRALTALVDVGTVLLVYAIGSLLWSRRVGLLAALLLAMTVLHVQLAHFWTVDPWLTFFATATLYASLRMLRDGRARDVVLAGTTVGLALACKVSALPLVVLPVVALGLRLLKSRADVGRDELRAALAATSVATLAGLAVFRVAQPYAFDGLLALDGRFVAAIAEQRRLTAGELDSPPFVQWANRSALFPLQNIALWGMGLPLAAAAAAGVVLAIRRLRREREVELALVLIAAAVFVLPFAVRFAAFARYFQPAYPALVLLAAWALSRLAGRWPGRGGLGALAAVGLTAAWAVAYVGIYDRPHSRVEASRWIYERIPAGATLTHESWDDALPLPLAGADADYRTVALDMYRTDSVEKIDELVSQLDEADYVVLSSDRVRLSVTQIPVEYPATTRYYAALEDGSLGFRLVRRFESRPTFLGLEVPDASAEESLTVYDHPTVRIYEKSPAYDRAQARALLLATRPERALDVTPRGGDVNGLMLTDEDARAQRQGGTWLELFGRKVGAGEFVPSTFPRERPLLAWLLALELMSLIALPLVLVVLRALPDRGYPLAKPLGLLLVALPVWLGVSLGLWHFTARAVAAAVAAVGVTSAIVAYGRRAELASFVRRRLPRLVATEVLFVGAFLAFYAIRLANPDLWHPVRGGEKPMDLAYLAATAKSTTLPPYDPWFAGGYLNYSYFGHFLTAVVVKLLGIAPEVAFNLAVPTYAALLTVAVSSLGANLVEATSLSRRRRPRSFSPTLVGLLAAVLVVAGGNLRGVEQWADTLRGDDTWGIDEDVQFPFFSFLLGDLHAHLMALPLAAAAACVALSLVVATPVRPRLRERFPVLALLGLLIGALAATNAWNAPTQAGLAAAAVAFAAWRAGGGGRRFGWLQRGATDLAIVAATAFVVFRPFLADYDRFDRGFTLTSATTPLRAYLAHFGILLVLLLPLLALGVGVVRRQTRARRQASAVAGPLGAGGAIVLAATALACGAVLLAGLVTFALLALAAVAVAAVGVRAARSEDAGMAACSGLVLAAVVLSATPELVRVNDDVGRMNTVRELYLQSWWLFGVAAAYAMWTAFARRPRLAAAGLAIALAAAGVYPLSALPARVADRFAPIGRGNDGAAYMAAARYEDDRGRYDLRRDYAAILWLRHEALGSPVLLEGVTPPYRWGNRFSVYTGLPAVVGWDVHQAQQRSRFADEVARRRQDVDDFYTSRSPRRSLEVLRRYDVGYVIVGQVERAYYGPATSGRVARLPGLTRRYDAPGVQLYAVDQDRVAAALG